MLANSGTPKGANVASIFQRKGVLYIKYSVNDKVKRKSTGLKDTPENRKLILKEVLPKFEAKIALGQLDEKVKKRPFEYYANKYLEYKQELKSFNHIYGRVVNKILPVFKGMLVDEIKRTNIKDFTHGLLKTLSPKTVSNILSVLNGIFEIAIEDEVIKDNVCEHIKLPQHNKDEIEPFTPDEVEKILESIKEEWFKNFVAIGFYTGMRTGEIMALMANDIDYNNKSIKVRRSINRGKVQTPKTKTSIRDVPMFDVLIPYLKSQQALSKQLFLFTDKGEPYYEASYISKRRWKLLLDSLGIKYRRLYTTRHTFISAMLRTGKLSLLDIARIVGHSNTQMIITNYARFIDGEQLKIRRDFNVYEEDVVHSLGHRAK